MPRTSISRETRQKARALRNTPTGPERKFWLKLRESKLPGVRFRRQAPIGPYIADFAWLSGRLIVELDGETHGTEGQAAHDAVRDAYLAERGFRVLRFSNRDVTQNMEGALEAVLLAVKEAAPPETAPIKK